jgi:hypothetical protein
MMFFRSTVKRLSAVPTVDFQLIDLRKCTRNFAESLNFDRFNRYPKRSSRRFTLLDVATSAFRIAGIHEQRNARQTANHILEQLDTFRAQVERHIRQARYVSARPRQTFDKLVANGIGNEGEDNRYGGGCALGGQRGWTRYCDQYVRLELRQFGRQADEPLRIFRREAILQYDVSALDVAETGKSFA